MEDDGAGPTAPDTTASTTDLKSEGNRDKLIAQKQERQLCDKQCDGDTGVGIMIHHHHSLAATHTKMFDMYKKVPSCVRTKYVYVPHQMQNSKRSRAVREYVLVQVTKKKQRQTPPRADEATLMKGQKCDFVVRHPLLGTWCS